MAMDYTVRTHNAGCFVHKVINWSYKIRLWFIVIHELLMNHCSPGNEPYGNMHWAETGRITNNHAKQPTPVLSRFTGIYCLIINHYGSEKCIFILNPSCSLTTHGCCHLVRLVSGLLTHLPLDKMAAILADDIFKPIFFYEKVQIFIKISLKFVPKGPIDNNPALV